MVDMDVVIPTYGRPVIVNQTLRMLLNQVTLPKSVIVVNQTPGFSEADEEVQQLYRDANLDLVWINRQEPNLCGARNDALLAATSKICLFLDDDIIPPVDLINKHWMRYQDGTGWQAVGGQVLHRIGDTAADSLSLSSPNVGTVSALQESRMVIGGPLFGCHFSLHREAALAVGGWDEAFVGSANWEEGDLINRLRGHGFPFVWDPNIWLIHLRLPMGGCRIPGNKSFSEWTKTTNFFMYKFRYPNEKSWKEVLISALRAGPLRREVVSNPWRWPAAWLGILKGWWLGKKKAHNPVLPLAGMSANNDQVVSRRSR